MTQVNRNISTTYRFYLRTEVHFFVCIGLGNERTQVTCKSCQTHVNLLKDLQATPVLSLPYANKKVYFNPYIYAKATNNP